MLFQTKRLSIRPLETSDLEGFHEMQSEPDVMKYTTGRAFTRKENEEDLKSVIRAYSNPENEFWVWAVEDRNSNAFVGTVAIVRSELESNFFEIGFRFQKKYWGMGFASEIVDPLIQFGYKKMDLNTLVAYVDERNVGSIKVLRKANPISESQIINPETSLPDLRFVYQATPP